MRNRCPHCGDSVVIVAGGNPVCPACVAAVLLDEDDASSFESEMNGQSRGVLPAHDYEELDLSLIEIPGFTLLEPVGRGGAGIVYRALQQAPRREVAIKILSAPGVVTSKEARARFAREIELAGSLQHPGIVPVYECGLAKEGGILYYAMELIDGLPLDRFLATQGAALDEMLALFEKVCVAVIYAHRQGVIHRDITPANILVTPEGDPRLLDFGLGKALADPDPVASQQVSSQGSILGSPCTMSPEQAAGKADVDTRSDVYSLGAILYYLVTGHWPHDQDGAIVDVLHRIAHEPARPASRFTRDLGTGLRAILDAALAADPESRYQSVDGLAGDIARYRQNEELSVRPLTAWQRFALWRRRKPLSAALWAMGILFIMTLAIGGPLLAMQQARLRVEIEKREAARHRDIVRLLVISDSSNLLELFQAIDDDFILMAPLLRKQLTRLERHPAGSEVRLKSALLASEPDLEAELVHFLKHSSDVLQTQLIAYALRRRAGSLSRQFMATVNSGDLPPKSGTLLNHFIALARWAPDDGSFWGAHAEAALSSIMAVSNRRGRGTTRELAEIFVPVGHYLKPYLESLATIGNRSARILLAGFVDNQTHDTVEAAIGSDAAFLEIFPRLKSNRVEALAELTAIYQRELAEFRQLPVDSPDRFRLGRVAVAILRLDRDNPVWRQLGYNWPLRGVLIEALPRLGVEPELLHWKLRRANRRSRRDEAIRSAIARCFLEFQPKDFSPEIRDNIIKRQREVIDATVPSLEQEPVETARQLLRAWKVGE